MGQEITTGDQPEKKKSRPMGAKALETLKSSRGIRIVKSKHEPESLRRFLDALAKFGVVTWACRAAGFSQTAAKYYMALSQQGDSRFVIQWRDAEGPFHELVQDAVDTAVDAIEGHVFKRANGYEEVLTYQGRVQFKIDPDAVALYGAVPGSPESWLRDAKGNPVPETVEKQSEELQMFVLKHRRPDIYGQRAQIDVLHRGGVLVVHAKAKNSAELEAMEKEHLTNAVDVEFREIDPE